jgi:predicted pyridoxine 5'-phosphate oxidase superfamily flavin-nucleotide-binding protein
MKNLLTNPHIGLIFLVPGREETLRINGRAWITKDPELLARSAAQGKTPQLAIGVEVEQCFLHCVKAFRRSKLWVHSEWPAPEALASMAQVLFDQIQPSGVTVQDYACEMEERNQKQLY